MFCKRLKKQYVINPFLIFIRTNLTNFCFIPFCLRFLFFSLYPNSCSFTVFIVKLYILYLSPFYDVFLFSLLGYSFTMMYLIYVAVLSKLDNFRFYMS